jgi:hypothetical protein
MAARDNAPILFLYTGWMRKYAGPDANDPTRGNHRWLRAHPHGYEAYNFVPEAGRLYGYAPIPKGIAIERLGVAQSSDFVDGVLVVWIARKPNTRRTVIVGWYSNARVFREAQPPLTPRIIENDPVFYRVEAAFTDCVLLLPDARNFPIPSNKERKGGYGMSPIWYGLADPNFRRSIYSYVLSGGSTRRSRSSKGPPRNLDPQNRLAIEKFAMDHAAVYFASKEGGERLVTDVSRGAKGWDLEAVASGEKLLVEVKGLSQGEITVELTPNEYNQMRSARHRPFYTVYVVTDCLRSEARAHIFRYIHVNDRWESDDGHVLQIQPKLAAVLRCRR